MTEETRTVEEEVVDVSAADTEAIVEEQVVAAQRQMATAEETDSNKKIVRLSVGQELTGTVKRTTDFGVFVDIGAGRDGLIHVSELSVDRVQSPKEFVQKGQTVTVWIKRLDRERNRISLTMISPDTKTLRDLQKDEIIEGTVTRLVPYGAFIDIGVGTDALLHVREMGNNYIAKPEDVVEVGETFDVRIIAINRRRRRIDLSIKGLREEPEEEVPEEVVDSNDEVVDRFENVEVLSPMELAFKRAMEAEGEEIPLPKAKRRRKRRARSTQAEIIQRTLNTMRE